MSSRYSMFLFAALLLVSLSRAVESDEPAVASMAPPLPSVLSMQGDTLTEVHHYGVLNKFTLSDLHQAVQTDTAGHLSIDFSHVTHLLDGTEISSSDLAGYCHYGPYPFEAKESSFPYKRFRSWSWIQNGQARIRAASFLHAPKNSEDWAASGQLVLRFELSLVRPERDRDLGTYDIFVRFRVDGERVIKLPVLVEGPFVGLATSDQPGQCTIRFTIDRPLSATVVVDGKQRFESQSELATHVVTISEFEPMSHHTYTIECDGDTLAGPFPFVTAPPKGTGPIRFAYAGDSRSSVGGGERHLMGVNHWTLERLMSIAYHEAAAFFLMGGDLVSGHTSVPEDFEVQLYGWKQAASGYWRTRPLYAAMGNHEALLRAYRDPHQEVPEGERERFVLLDRWPYTRESAEAIFGRAFMNPNNGPEPADPLRPPYAGNVFSFHYGWVKIICFNNNYWYANEPSRCGGAPEGYIFDEQLDWIREQLEEAETDPTVKYVFLFAQEPVLPCGGHVDDSMWYLGDNTIRAYTTVPGTSRLEPFESGIVEVRNRLIRMIAASSKVAAVFGADEHAYHRVLVNRDVPLGSVREDDTDGDGRICQEGEPCSPLSDLPFGVWYVISGGAGAPFYTEEPTPWNTYWKEMYPAPEDCREVYYYSSQEHILLLNAERDHVSLTVINAHGEVFDRIPDLMARK